MGYIHTVELQNEYYKIQPLLYGVQSNSSASAITTTINNFELISGVQIALKMAVVNDTSATLSINSGTAVPIYYEGQSVLGDLLQADCIYNMVYDDSKWHVIGKVTDNDTKVRVIHLEGA